MPWHPVELDAQGRVLAWYQPDKHLGYDQFMRLDWGFLEHKVPIHTVTNAKVYLTAGRIPHPEAGYGNFDPLLIESLSGSKQNHSGASGDRRVARNSARDAPIPKQPIEGTHYPQQMLLRCVAVSTLVLPSRHDPDCICFVFASGAKSIT